MKSDQPCSSTCTIPAVNNTEQTQKDNEVATLLIDKVEINLSGDTLLYN